MKKVKFLLSVVFVLSLFSCAGWICTVLGC